LNEGTLVFKMKSIFFIFIMFCYTYFLQIKLNNAPGDILERSEFVSLIKPNKL
jgi:hypothetical protein